MINIISNAIKYTDNEGKIEVKLEWLPDNRLRFCCKDNGIGMTEAFIGHITEDYVRAEDSRVSKIQGTGLGMSVVKGFTDLMRGTLKVTSKVGAGSTFIVEIPMDMQMPVMDGVEAAKKIRTSDRRDKDVLIFAMTANTFASDRKRCREAGMNGYIAKPISVAEIARTLQEKNIG